MDDAKVADILARLAEVQSLLGEHLIEIALGLGAGPMGAAIASARSHHHEALDLVDEVRREWAKPGRT